MDDLIDRLAVLAPPLGRDLDVAFVRTRGRRRQHRRAAVLRLSAVAVILLGGLGAVRLVRDDSQARQVITTTPPSSEVPAAWGGPDAVVAGGDELFLRYSSVATDGGIARFDPVSGHVAAVAPVPLGSEVAYGRDRLWVHSGVGSDVVALDPRTGEEIGRFPVGSPSYDDGLAADDEVWLASTSLAQPVRRLDLESGRFVVALDDPLLARQALAVGEALWVGTDDGLVRVTPEGATRFTVPELHRPVTGLAWDGSSIWVTTFGGPAGVTAMGRLDPSAPADARLSDASELPDLTRGLGVASDGLCLVDQAVVGGYARCGPISSSGEVDLGILRGDATPLDPFVAFDGRLWVTNRDDGDVIAIDPASREQEVVLDTPFDLDAALRELAADEERRTAAVGPTVEVARGSDWSYEAWPTADGACGQFVYLGTAQGEDCTAPLTDDVLAVGYRDARFLPFFAWTFTNADVAKVRFVLQDGSVFRVPAVAITSEIRVAAQLIPDDAVIERTEARDDDGNVLDTSSGSAGVPDD